MSCNTNNNNAPHMFNVNIQTHDTQWCKLFFLDLVIGHWQVDCVKITQNLKSHALHDDDLGEHDFLDILQFLHILTYKLNIGNVLKNTYINGLW